jgi:hypothetical protein
MHLKCILRQKEMTQIAPSVIRVEPIFCRFQICDFVIVFYSVEGCVVYQSQYIIVPCVTRM